MTVRVLQAVEIWLPQTQSWIYNQVRELPADIACDVVCETTVNLDQFPFPSIHALDQGPTVRSVVDRGLRFLGVRRHLGFLRRQVRRLRPDVLHSHFGHVGWMNLGALAGMAVPHVVTFYGFDLSLLPASDARWRKRYRQLFQDADLFLCEGPHMAEQLASLGCPKAKIAVHRIGVDLERIPFQPRRWSPSEPLRVLIAASFREKKGIPYAIEALARLRNSVPLAVTVIGDAKPQNGEDAEKVRILERIEATGLSPVTRLLGYQPYDVLMEEARSHHLFLSPSVTATDGDTEGGAPVVLLDMAASGMPIVSTRHCDIPQVVLHGVNAVLVQERDVDGLVQAMRTLLNAHEQWPGRLAEGRRHVERLFDVRVQARALADRYAALAAAPASRTSGRQAGNVHEPGSGTD